MYVNKATKHKQINVPKLIKRAEVRNGIPLRSRLILQSNIIITRPRNPTKRRKKQYGILENRKRKGDRNDNKRRLEDMNVP